MHDATPRASEQTTQPPLSLPVSLGLDPVAELVAVDVVVELSPVTDNDASRGAFSDEATARDVVGSLLANAHSYGYTPAVWQIRDLRTTTRRTVTTDTSLEGVVLQEDTATTTNTTVVVAGEAAIDPIQVTSRDTLTDEENESVTAALQPLFRKLGNGYFNSPTMHPTLLEITGRHFKE